jgi:hypothetical protein
MPEVKTQSERVSARGLAQSRAYTKGRGLINTTQKAARRKIKYCRN